MTTSRIGLLPAVTGSAFKCAPTNNLRCCPCPAVRSVSWSWQGEMRAGVKVSVKQLTRQPGAAGQPASWCRWGSLHSDCKGDPSVGEAEGGNNS